MRNRSIWLLTFVLTLVSAYAQDTEIKLDTQVVEVDLKPWVSDAIKINFHPQLDHKNDSVVLQKYDLPVVLYEFDYTPKTIRPLAYRKPKPKSLNNNYVQLGIGAPLNYLSQLHLMSKRNKKWLYGALVHYDNLQGSIDNQTFRNLDAILYGKRVFKKSELAVNLLLDNNYRSTFSVNNDVTPFNSSLSSIGGKLHWKNNPTNKQSFQIGWRNNIFSTKATQAKETFIQSDLNILKPIKKGKLEIDFNQKLLSISDSNNTPSNYLFNSKAAYQFEISQTEFELGIFVSKDAGQARVFPQIASSKDLIKDNLVLYAEINSYLFTNGIRDLSDKNPFMDWGLYTKENTYSNEKIGGFKGKIDSRWSYDLQYNYNNLLNAPLFVSVTNNTNAFEIVYADIDIQKTSAKLSFQSKKRWKSVINANWLIINSGNQTHAWHLPNFNLIWNLNYNLQDKIQASLDIFSQSRTYNRADLKELENSGFVDINIGLDYIYHKSLSFYLDIRNLLGTKYSVYWGLPSVGRTAQIGVKLSL